MKLHPYGAGLFALGIALACSSNDSAPVSDEARVAASAIEHVRALNDRFGVGFLEEDPGVIEAVVVSPSNADAATRLVDLRSGVWLEFSLEGASASARPLRHGSFVVYAGGAPGAGDLFQRVSRHGVEDWVFFERPAPTPVLTYRLRVAPQTGLRLVANVLEIIDASGTPRLRVAPPFVIVQGLGRHPAQLGVQDCAVDTDPRPPWGRPVAAPGSESCKVTVSWSGDLEYPMLVDPLWATTRSMATARRAHTASVLADGRVLVAAGLSHVVLPSGPVQQYEDHLSSSEIYDPTTETWATTGSLTEGRNGHVQGTLADGRVLVAGGYYAESPPYLGSASYPLSSAEIYDPSTGQWTVTDPMSVVRNGHTMTLLDDGRALVIGGYHMFTLHAVAEAYDATSETWEAAGSMVAARQAHTATRLSDGRVLVAGGTSSGAGGGGNDLSSAELFDPGSNSFSATGSLSRPRMRHRSVRLGDGRVLVTGGERSFYGGDVTSDAEVYDPTTGTFAAAASMSEARQGHSLTRLPSGAALVVGGDVVGDFGSTSAEVFANGAWVAVDSLSVGRARHTATPLSGGDVLVAGGQGDSFGDLSSAVRFALVADGDPCSLSDVCQSGYCVDGVCCDGLCDGVCEACTQALKGSGPDGACGPIGAGNDPEDECPVDAGFPTNCAGDGYCDGAGACRQEAPAGVGCGTPSCSDGVQVTQACDGAGTCVESETACAPYRCKDATTCGLSCAIDADCVSNLCVSGICCDTACGGQCESCSLPGQEGTCVAVSGTPPEGKASCNGAGTTCAGTCDGVNRDACRYPGADTSCGAGMVCSDGDCVRTGNKCSDDLLGSIDDQGAVTECGEYLCDRSTGGCRDKCTDTADCAPGHVCSAPVCVLTEAATDSGEEPEGCGCRLPGRPRSPGDWGWLAGMVALLLATRRRLRLPWT